MRVLWFDWRQTAHDSPTSVEDQLLSDCNSRRKLLWSADVIKNQYRYPSLKAEVSGSPHNPARNGSAPTLVCERVSISNRNSKLLEFPLSYRKQRIGQFLIATFRDSCRLLAAHLPHPSSPRTHVARLEHHSIRPRKLEIIQLMYNQPLPNF